MGRLVARFCEAAKPKQQSKPQSGMQLEKDTDAAPLASTVHAATPQTGHGMWGIWESVEACGNHASGKDQQDATGSARRAHMVRLCIDGEEVCGCFGTRDEALAFQVGQLALRLGWPRAGPAGLSEPPVRDPVWDHPEDLEPHKEYNFREAAAEARVVQQGGATAAAPAAALTQEQLRSFDARGFLLGLPVLDPTEGGELDQARAEFEDLLASRVDRAPTDEARFRSAHTLSRPLHQNLVARLARHARVLGIVEDILGPRFVCWSAHLFCKLPGDPTEQPWHQDAGFWPLSQSRALTLWLALDDVDTSNAAVTFVAGSHRMGRLPWGRTAAAHKLLTQEVPDVDLLGPRVPAELRAGEASVHCDLTVHGSPGNGSARRRAGLALRFVAAEAECLGPMINGYRMNGGCILPRGRASDPRGHWRALRRRPGGSRAPRWPVGRAAACSPETTNGEEPQADED